MVCFSFETGTEGMTIFRQLLPKIYKIVEMICCLGHIGGKLVVETDAGSEVSIHYSLRHTTV